MKEQDKEEILQRGRKEEREEIYVWKSVIRQENRLFVRFLSQINPFML